MSPLLEVAINAHGGLERWRRVSAVRASASITGAIWSVKGCPDVLKDVSFVVDTKRERLVMEFPGRDKQTVFEPTRVVILNARAEVIAARDDPRRSFDGHRADTPWDEIHVAYFSGEALWTYFNVPFLYAEAGFHSEEISPITVDGETWRRLKVTFPEAIQSHSRTQISCFGADGLLRRHDYTVDILGGASGLNYAYDYRNVDGILIPTTRRVCAYEGDYRPVKEPVLVAIDIGEVRLL